MEVSRLGQGLKNILAADCRVGLPRWGFVPFNWDTENSSDYKLEAQVGRKLGFALYETYHIGIRGNVQTNLVKDDDATK